MKILWENEQVEIIEAGTNEVVFTTSLLDYQGDNVEEDEEEDEEEVDVAALPLLTYRVKLYKNAQSQQPERTIKVRAANMYVQAINDTTSILYLLNQQKQAVYCTSWDLVHSIDSEDA